MYWEYKAEVPTENYAYPSAEQAIEHFQKRAIPYTEHHLGFLSRQCSEAVF